MQPRLGTFLVYFISEIVTNIRQNLIGFSAPTLCVYEFYYGRPM